MLIGSKLPPHRTDTTYFSTGRAAFAYLIGQRVKPNRVYLPTFVCWSLVSTMERRFPDCELVFYPVDRHLHCGYPTQINEHEALVFIHYFGYTNSQSLPRSEGALLEDLSHAYLSRIELRGDYVFGSYRKITKVADGGFVRGRFNPVYEPSRKLDTWLRLQAKDWRDVREAENMLDRDWAIADISSQSLAVLLTVNHDLIRHRRQENDHYLSTHLTIGRTFREYNRNECPLVHNRLLGSRDERDALRQFLAKTGIYTSIHWPTHARVRAAADQVDITETLWLEDHILSIPIAEDYGLNDMEAIVSACEAWRTSGV